MTSVILGIDPAMHGLGWGVIDGTTGRVLGAGYTALSTEGWLEHAVTEALDKTDERRHGWEITNLVVERVGGGKGVQSMLRVADIAGIVAGAAVSRWPEASIWRPTPSEWKRGAGLPGNAKKPAVREHAMSLLDRSAAWVPALDLRQDTLDAICMADAEFTILDARRA